MSKSTWHIAAQYKCNHPGGLGVEMVLSETDFHKVSLMLNHLAPEMRADFTDNEADEVLRDFAMHREKLTTAGTMVAIALIKALEESGSLIPDAFNGVMISRGTSEVR